MRTKKEKILVVVAHPDDAELGMGMKIYDYVQKGHEVFIHCLSKGAVDDSKLAQKRVDECLAAAKVLGVEHYSFSDTTDTQFIEERLTINSELFSLINKIRPDRVYTHYPEDQHHDHSVTASEVLVVAEREVYNIVYFRSPYSKNFRPNHFFFASGEHVEKKYEALKCFESQKQIDMDIIKQISSTSHYQHIHHRVMRNVHSKLDSTKVYGEQFFVEREIQLTEAT